MNNLLRTRKKSQTFYKHEHEKSLCMSATMWKGAGNNGMTLVPNKQYISKKSVEKYVEDVNAEFNDPYNKKTVKGDKSTTLRTNSSNGNMWVNDKAIKETKPKQVGVAVDINGHDILKRVYSPNGKSPTLNSMNGGNRQPKVVKGGAFRARSIDKDGNRVAWKEVKPKQMLELRKDDKSNTVSSVPKDSLVVEDLSWRKLTPLECEELQTVPDNYTNHVSNTQRYKMLGNGWTVEVIKHILKNTMKLVFDIETDDIKATKIWCIVAIDEDNNIKTFDLDNIEEGIKYLQQADALIGHNILGFDIPVIKDLYGVDLYNKKIIDTLVISRLINPNKEKGHSLKNWGFLLGQNKGTPPEDFTIYSKEMLDYCVLDVQQ